MMRNAARLESFRAWCRWKGLGFGPVLRAALFALTLPIAQALAAGHAFSHLHSGEPDHSGRADAALHIDACGLCLASAAIGAGTAISSPPALPAPTGAFGLLSAPRFQSRCAGHPAAYLSRAPPPTSS